jgi:hypothetical protein
MSKGPKISFGFGESCEEIIETPALQVSGKLMDQGAFCCARRSQQEEIFARDECDTHQVDDVVLAHEGCLHGSQQLILQKATDWFDLGALTGHREKEASSRSSGSTSRQ